MKILVSFFHNMLIYSYVNRANELYALCDAISFKKQKECDKLLHKKHSVTTGFVLWVGRGNKNKDEPFRS